MNPIAFYLARLVLVPILILLVQIVCCCKTILLDILQLLIPSNLPRVVRTPEDRFKGLESLGYTFKSNYVDLPIGGGKTLPRVHYVDEGPRDAQETILCLHGLPSWSFLYRHMIHAFVKAGYRVIAPDFIGFGKSDKYVHPKSYTHDLHTQTLRLLLDHLKVENITLVGQDWGGTTGLTVVKDCPHLFSRLVILNCRLAIKPGLPYQTLFIFWKSISALFGTHLPIKKLFKVALQRGSPAVYSAYDAPFPSSLFKGGVARWPLLAPMNYNTPVATEMKEAGEFVSNDWKHDILLMFGIEDILTIGWFLAHKKMLPKAKVKTIARAGHFLQEDKGEELAENVIMFINNEF